jgi:hypothetical protein
MKLPNKAYRVEIASDGTVFYYRTKEEANWGNLETKSRKLKLPKWLNEAIRRDLIVAEGRGYNAARKKVHDTIATLLNF